ncbi:hypothetical protein Ancab_008112 [Ancistrocladus abbreviatus]
MAFKASVLFLTLLAITLAISSEATARDMAEKSHSELNVGEVRVEDDKYYGNGGNPEGESLGRGGYNGPQHGNYYCRYGCCRYCRYRYGCCMCCSAPGKAAEAEIENKP